MESPKKKNIVLLLVFALSFITGLVFLILPFTSQLPDGLEKISEETIGFLKKDDFKPLVNAPMPDYTIPRLKNRLDTRQIAGIAGIFVVFGIMVLVGFLLKKKRKT